MKRFLLIIGSILLVFSLTSCGEELSDSEKFLNEYTQVQEYNVFSYRNKDEIIKILKHGTGLVYLGFPECKWCQAYVPILNEVADSSGLEVIYYFDILEDRTDNTEEYQEIVTILSDYLQYDNEGNKRVYVPAIIAVLDGEIIGFDDETSYDTLGYDEPGDYWTDERVDKLKNKLTEMIEPIVLDSCSDCNK